MARDSSVVFRKDRSDRTWVSNRLLTMLSPEPEVLYVVLCFDTPIVNEMSPFLSADSGCVDMVGGGDTHGLKCDHRIALRRLIVGIFVICRAATALSCELSTSTWTEAKKEHVGIQKALRGENPHLFI